MSRLLPHRKALLVSAATSAVLALGMSTSAFAAGPPTTYTPGAPNCHGQFVASSNNNGIPALGYDHLSIGQAAKVFGVSVTFLQAYADTKCQAS